MWEPAADVRGVDDLIANVFRLYYIFREKNIQVFFNVHVKKKRKEGRKEGSGKVDRGET